ncbi:flavin reductase family protein [Bryobacter aggregatus]|uniref:flavin reductase family protein n=1 Tax=Bryobacter aggregatus TaxID=360054 RepID=UPI0009B5C049|nr:flavin reductase family protein [Bryobacter aggregatus]
MTIYPEEENPRDIYKLMIGMVVPRPIAWVSTISERGVPNLAPFSFFNALSGDPPVVCFSPSRRPIGDSKKDTLRNLEFSRDFVVNIVSEHLAEAMNRSSEEVPEDVDEFPLAGVSSELATLVKSPMVREALAKMECRVRSILPLGDRPTSGVLVLGDVVCFHFAEGLVHNFRVDPAMLAAVGRMGGSTYCDTRNRFDLLRPSRNLKE